MGFVGAMGAGDFILVLGEILFLAHVFILKMLRFFRGFRICQRHVKQFSAHLLPTSEFIPRIECWGLSTGGYIVCSFFLCCPLLGSSSAGWYIVRSFFLCCPVLGAASARCHKMRSFFLPDSIKPSMF